MADRSTHEVRGTEEVRGESVERGKPLNCITPTRSFNEALTRSHFLARADEVDHNDTLIKKNVEKESFYMPNIIKLAGKQVGDPIVVFPDTIAGGSFIPGTLIRIVDNFLIQISVGTVVIQDGAWKPISPFVAGDQVFVPIKKIDAFV